MPSVNTTVLIVEDESAALRVIKAALSNAGFQVLAAGSGHKALTICREYQGAIHIALVDILMPGMTGRELGKCLKEEFPGIRILYMSGYPQSVLSQGIDVGDAAFIPKPFTSRDLVARIRAEIEKPRTASGDCA
jgi:DNA-binding response OmpR family regulator